jgi:amino acid transporter
MASFDAAVFRTSDANIEPSSQTVNSSQSLSESSNPTLAVRFRGSNESFWEAAEYCLIFADIETHYGRPSWLIGLLGFLGARPFPAKILGHMVIFCTCSIVIVFLFVSTAFLFFYTRTINGDPNDNVTNMTTAGAVLNRNSSAYPYKSHLQRVRDAYCLVGFFLLILFNGWRSFLRPFSPPDFIASYIGVLLFVVITELYHVKDEKEWNPLEWTRRVTMNIHNPTVTRENNLELRKGRLHRANKQVYFWMENAVQFWKFVWDWLK